MRVFQCHPSLRPCGSSTDNDQTRQLKIFRFWSKQKLFLKWSRQFKFMSVRSDKNQHHCRYLGSLSISGTVKQEYLRLFSHIGKLTFIICYKYLELWSVKMEAQCAVKIWAKCGTFAPDILHLCGSQFENPMRAKCEQNAENLPWYYPPIVRSSSNLPFYCFYHSDDVVWQLYSISHCFFNIYSRFQPSCVSQILCQQSWFSLIFPFIPSEPQEPDSFIAYIWLIE